MIRLAICGPIPGSEDSCFSVALLMSMALDGKFTDLIFLRTVGLTLARLRLSQAGDARQR